jgi:hypothetical protein
MRLLNVFAVFAMVGTVDAAHIRKREYRAARSTSTGTSSDVARASFSFSCSLQSAFTQGTKARDVSTSSGSAVFSLAIFNSHSSAHLKSRSRLWAT